MEEGKEEEVRGRGVEEEKEKEGGEETWAVGLVGGASFADVRWRTRGRTGWAVGWECRDTQKNRSCCRLKGNGLFLLASGSNDDDRDLADILLRVSSDFLYFFLEFFSGFCSLLRVEPNHTVVSGLGFGVGNYCFCSEITPSSGWLVL